MKNLSFVCVRVDGGKRYAHAEKVNTNSNIASFCQYYDIVQYCETWNKAVELADFWNECYKKNGTFDYDFIGGRA